MRSSLFILGLSCVGGTIVQQTVWGQCGGIGWTGATSCKALSLSILENQVENIKLTNVHSFLGISGNVCTYQNDYYSQCIPGTATTTTAKATTTSKAATTSPKPTTTSTKTTVTTTATKTIAAPAGSCLCTAWSQISAAQKSCMTLTLSGIKAPASSAVVLNSLQPSATVIFAGTLSWEKTPSNAFRPLQISGDHLTIKGAPGSVLDGSGPLYWDGLGDGGQPKPGQFSKIQVSNSLITDLYFLNFPNHGINVAGCSNTVLQNIYVDNKAGFSTNSISSRKPAAHNTDAFDVGNSNNMVLHNLTVYNQDDCVVVSDCNNVTVTNTYCYGSHDLSINGGGSSGTHVTENITFKDCKMENSGTPIRIKTDSGGEGSVLNIRYENIAVGDIQKAAIDIEQNYGGPTTNSVLIKGVTYKNITGSVDTGAKVYNLICGSGSCQDITFSNIHVTGATAANSCEGIACPS
ncbi:Polygalacturonase [Dactylellina cionopaga]|nr:Polygalacturonase [Dactylellina cionopaga]